MVSIFDYKKTLIISVISVVSLLLLVSINVTYDRYRSSINNKESLYTESSCECDFILHGLDIRAGECSDSNYPVLGGVDLVNYFTSFKISEDYYDETKIGSIGYEEFSYQYKGYTYYFTSLSNKELFIQSPESYLPQYGGFCAYGVTNEYCPSYPWAADCLGPPGNWAQWTIINNKLYFFYNGDAKALFKESYNDLIPNGDSRWSYWFADNNDIATTVCFVQS